MSMSPPGCFVDDNGVEFPIGQIWSPGDPCELCVCQVNENLLCFTPPTCPHLYLHSHPFRVPIPYPHALPCISGVGSGKDGGSLSSCLLSWPCFSLCSSAIPSSTGFPPPPHTVLKLPRCGFSLYGFKVCATCSPSQADGSVSCKRTDCVETCPYPIHIPGQCCPDCSAGDGDSKGKGDDTGLQALQPHSQPIGCTYMGRIFYNNETFPSLLDPCLSCICLVRHVGFGVWAFGHPDPLMPSPHLSPAGLSGLLARGLRHLLHLPLPPRGRVLPCL